MYLHDHACQQDDDAERRERDGERDGRRGVRVDGGEQCELDHSDIGVGGKRQRSGELLGVLQHDRSVEDRHGDDSRKDFYGEAVGNVRLIEMELRWKKYRLPTEAAG